MTYEEAVAAIPLGKYRHYKGSEYEVIGIARHSETLEPMVVYRALYGEHGIWVRPAEMWNEPVLDGTVRRFTKTDESPYPIRLLRDDEVQAALDLTWAVFLEFEAPEYAEEGVRNFRAYLDDKEKTAKLRFYGAFDGETLVGTISVRAPQHIGGFFVRGDYHRRGIGRALFAAMARDFEKQEFTVNSSPYAVGVYQHLGFTATDSEQVVDGIRFTPMVYRK